MPYAYALRKGLDKRRVNRLAGVARAPHTIARFDYAGLVEIAKDCGIPVETLMREATAAAADPEPPLGVGKYPRRQKNGKAAAE